MSLITLIGLDDAPMTARPYFDDGDPGPIVAALANVPELLDAAMPFLGTVFGPSALSLRTKEIVVLRTSALLECRYCVDTHTVVARDAGLTHDEVVALRGETQDGVFAAASELALIAWIDVAARGPGVPPTAIGEQLSEHFSESDIVELTMLVGATLMLNRFATSLGLPTSPDTLQRLADEGLAASAA